MISTAFFSDNSSLSESLWNNGPGLIKLLFLSALPISQAFTNQFDIVD